MSFTEKGAQKAQGFSRGECQISGLVQNRELNEQKRTDEFQDIKNHNH